MTQKTFDRYMFLRGYALGMTPLQLVELEQKMEDKILSATELSHAALRSTVSELHRSLRAYRQAKNTACASFLFEHSEELVQLACANPKTLLRSSLDEFHPTTFIFGWTPEQIQEAKWWEEYIDKFQHHDEHPPILPGPAIFSVAPNPLEIGSQATLLGGWLGSTAGTATLVDCNGNRHQLNVLGWSETAVRVDVPLNISGIPFDCEGKIELKLADGLVISIRVMIEPQTILMYSVDPFSKKGASIHNYNKNHNFTSATLPSSFREHVFPRDLIYVYSGCVLFKISNTLLKVWDAGVKVTITDGPRVDNNSLVVSTKLSDDHVWNFTVEAEFYIIVPTGIPATGWSQV